MASTDFPAWYSAGVFGGIGCALLSAVTIAVWALWRRRGVNGQAIAALLVSVVASALDIGPLLWIEYRLNVYGPTLSVREVGAALAAAALVGWVAPLATLCWYLLLASSATPAPARGVRGGAVSPAALDDPDRVQAAYADGQPWGLLAPVETLAESASPTSSRPIALTQRLTLIGREVDNDLVLDDERISRRHAELRWERGRIELADYGSLNGTRVNEQAARGRLLLREGDIIELGKRRYRLILQPGAAKEGAPSGASDAAGENAMDPLETRKTARASDASMVGRPALRLVLVQGTTSAPGATWLLSAAVTTIGRDSSCDVSLADTSISRTHAQITRQPAGYFISDLQSSNGVYLNGQRLVSPAQVFAGDVVMLGDCLLRCEEVTAEASSAPPAPVATDNGPDAGAPAAHTVALTPTGAPEFHMRMAPLWSARRVSHPRLAPPRLRPTPPQRDNPPA